MTRLSRRSGGLTVGGRVGVVGAERAPDAVELVLRRRDGASGAVQAKLDRIVTTPHGPAVAFTARLAPADLPGRGVWAAELRVTLGTAVGTAPFGAERAAAVPLCDVVLDTNPVTVAFGTDQGTLAFDVGAEERPAGTDARIVGVELDGDGRPEALIEVEHPTPADLRILAYPTPRGSRGARHNLPTRWLGERTVAARLPVRPAFEQVRVELRLEAGGVERALRFPDNLRGPVRPGRIEWAGDDAGRMRLWTARTRRARLRSGARRLAARSARRLGGRLPAPARRFGGAAARRLLGAGR